MKKLKWPEDFLGKIIEGDCLEVMRQMPDRCINCCVTSPPYWGLRDYGVSGQLGLEKTPEEFVEKMVGVFSEVRRVLRDDGTLWLNLGDSYARTGGWASNDGLDGKKRGESGRAKSNCQNGNGQKCPEGLKQKDLVGIPWRVAFALQADGWYLRSDIIWHKPNPMPESVCDRPTKSHEYIFLMAKAEKYYYDHEAIKENSQPTNPSRNGFSDLQEFKRSGNKKRKPARARGVPVDDRGKTAGNVAGSVPWAGTNRNKRTVWTVGTRPFKEAHFATFPEDLIKPCILAGCPDGGIVLDPFMGAGTTALVAAKYGRKFAGCELNPEYAAMARKRVANEQAQGKLF